MLGWARLESEGQFYLDAFFTSLLSLGKGVHCESNHPAPSLTSPSPASAISKQRPWTRTYPCLPSNFKTSGTSVRYRTKRRVYDLRMRRKLGR